MEPNRRWSLATLGGLTAAGASYVLAEWPELALGTAFVATVAIGFYLRAVANLRARSDWNDDRTDGRVGGHLAGLLAFAGPFLLLALDLPTIREDLAVLGYVTLVAIGCFAVGVEFALSGLDDAST